MDVPFRSPHVLQEADCARMPPVPTLPRLIARALQPLPLAPLQLALALVLRSVVARHPNIFERLGAHAHKLFGIEPSDLPFAFVLAPHPETPTLIAVRSLPAGIPIRIAGPLLGLMGLIFGSFVVDAMFFSRYLVWVGALVAVMALRTAIDDAGVDLVADTAALFGPLAPMSERLLGGALLQLKGVAVAAKREDTRTWN